MLRELVERAIRVKIDVVVGDLKETGGGATGTRGREVLNYGHTLAHAIERAEGYRMRHGEAVAIGCVYVAELAGLRGRARRRDGRDRHRDGARSGSGCPRRTPARRFEELLAAMRVDKKARGSQLRFVVLDGLGRAGGPGGPDRGATCGRRTTRIGGGAAMKVLVLNGPNLGRLGPAAAGDLRHDDPRRAGRAVRRLGPRARARRRGPADQPRGRAARLAQRRPPTTETPVVLNAAAWTHYSLALFDACAQLTAPLVEVHISDPKQRPEEFRHTSVVEPHAVATIAGQGIDGYRQALEVVAGARPLTRPPRCCGHCCGC